MTLRASLRYWLKVLAWSRWHPPEDCHRTLCLRPERGVTMVVVNCGPTEGVVVLEPDASAAVGFEALDRCAEVVIAREFARRVGARRDGMPIGD